MLRQFDPATHAVIDLRDFSEVSGAIAADEETGEVHVIRPNTDGPQRLATSLPTGIRIVRRPRPKRPLWHQEPDSPSTPKLPGPFRSWMSGARPDRFGFCPENPLSAISGAGPSAAQPALFEPIRRE